ncbi:MAG: type II toxin-antitoxin system RelE/ParE family toxin [Myxococcales bacterium]|nr:type II toxin-antitoxin system RelE/ParE family toxin [Myxococcales bacterium]
MTVKWTRLALADLENAYEFISSRNDTAAASVVQQVMAHLTQLRQFPESGRTGRVKGTRELVVGATPFVIVYRVNAADLEILAVLHSARKWPP